MMKLVHRPVLFLTLVFTLGSFSALAGIPAGARIQVIQSFKVPSIQQKPRASMDPNLKPGEMFFSKGTPGGIGGNSGCVFSVAGDDPANGKEIAFSPRSYLLAAEAGEFKSGKGLLGIVMGSTFRIEMNWVAHEVGIAGELSSATVKVFMKCRDGVISGYTDYTEQNVQHSFKEYMTLKLEP